MSYTINDIKNEITKRVGIYDDSDTYYVGRAEVLFLQALLNLALSTDEEGQNKIPYENYQPLIMEEDFEINGISLQYLYKININPASTGTSLSNSAEKIISCSFKYGDGEIIRRIPLSKEEGEEYYLNSLFLPDERNEVYYWYDEKAIIIYINIGLLSFTATVKYISQITGYGIGDFVSDLGFSEIFINMAIDVATESLKREWSSL